MAFGNLDNCPRCGKVFVKGMRDVCPQCYEEIEAEYEKCVAFLRQKENRNANIDDLSKGTGVSVKQIIQFIRQGRISIADLPNMGIPCESCGKPIKQGRLCADCSNRLYKTFQEAYEQALEKKPEEDSGRSQGYQVWKLKRPKK
ncbi:membrane protein [Bacillaceae bacterium]